MNFRIAGELTEGTLGGIIKMIIERISREIFVDIFGEIGRNECL